VDKRWLILLSITWGLSFAPDARADKPGTLDVRTGFGEEVMVKHGLFGTTDTEVKDRLGDAYEDKNGLFSSEQGVNFLGNSYVKHKGLLSGTTVEGRSIFGDRIESKKSFFGLGPRKTTVDLSGVGSIVQQVTNKFLQPHVPVMSPYGAFIPGSQTGMPSPENNLDAAAGLSSPVKPLIPEGQPAPMQAMPRPYGP
jgi:hypothetical protein